MIDSLGELAGEKSITVSIEKNTDPSRHALITISDSGKGIDEAIFEKMFEPYTTTKFKHFGTGLSLYISKLIIEKNMKGRLYAKNTSEGARFIIEL